MMVSSTTIDYCRFIVDALGKTWLLTIEDAMWHASGGEHVTTIGPLPITPGAYAAQYMEAIFTPGMTAPAHTHSGPEAWYTVAGETCLETPAGKQIGRAGGLQSLSRVDRRCI
jgi:quercetin dioxygenase-like cupin family protein